MPKIERFEDLDCWKAARELINYVYDLTEKPALAKDFDTKSQIRRAGLGAMNNISEGVGRYSSKEFVRFLDISQSSGQEIRSMAYVLLDRKYIAQQEFVTLCEMANKLISVDNGLIKYLYSRTTGSR
ncbi:MAG TPA: four helix bundle protein [Chitinophagales bacterium]|nr:four helix bundle protein [Chitinophagales bacterium]